MSSETVIRIFDLLGVMTGIVLFWVVISFSKSLEGSFFGKYSRLMVVAAVLFGLSFVIEFFGDSIIPAFLFPDVIHHLLIIASGIILVYAGIILPKEATKVLKETKTIK